MRERASEVPARERAHVFTSYKSEVLRFFVFVKFTLFVQAPIIHEQPCGLDGTKPMTVFPLPSVPIGLREEIAAEAVEEDAAMSGREAEAAAIARDLGISKPRKDRGADADAPAGRVTGSEPSPRMPEQTQDPGVASVRLQSAIADPEDSANLACTRRFISGGHDFGRS